MSTIVSGGHLFLKLIMNKMVCGVEGVGLKWRRKGGIAICCLDCWWEVTFLVSLLLEIFFVLEDWGFVLETLGDAAFWEKFLKSKSSLWTFSLC